MVYMNDQALGFTLELGKTWELWMAFRELYCNCLDEGGMTYEGSAQVPSPGTTRVIVTGNDFFDIYVNRSDYFITEDRTSILSCEEVEIFATPSSAIFYRGIRVAELPKMSLYTYNLRQTVLLAEDRSLTSTWTIESRIATAIICHIFDRSLLRRILTCGSGFFEGTFSYLQGERPSDEFLSVVEELASEGATDLNPQAYNRWKTETGKTANYTEVELTAVQTAMLARAVSFCKNIGTALTFNVKVVETLGGRTLGRAEDETIYIARKAFDSGTKIVAGTLIEEQVHLQFGYVDESRELQDWLLNKLVTLGEELSGEPL